MKHSSWKILLFLTFLTFSLPRDLDAQVIDDSPTRVQTTLESGMKEVGTLKPKNIHEISTSRWSLGCETIDREFSDYDSYKEYLPALGIKRIRLQGGWARTEKEQNLYDFAWLDHIIDDARSRGHEIWLETSYGNPIYSGGGGRNLSGGMPASEEALKAWDHWVQLMARRYKDKVRDWCVWNEPELRGANDPTKIIDFNIRTAEIIRAEIPNARIAALALCWPNMKIITPFLERLKADKKLDLFQWIVYHHYTMNPDTRYEGVDQLLQTVRQYSSKMKIWQGESGTQSDFGANGALCKYDWTELTQAKWNTRRMLGDLAHDADSLVFTAGDLDYRAVVFHGGLLRYGLIKTAGAAQGYKVLKVKISYYAVQNVVSVFNDDIERIADFSCETSSQNKIFVFACRHLKSQKPILVFWDSTNVPKNTNETSPATFKIKGYQWKNPVWVDTITGNVYEIPKEKMVVDSLFTIFKDIPVYDAPVFITDKEILDLQYSSKVLYEKEQKNLKK